VPALTIPSAPIIAASATNHCPLVGNVWGEGNILIGGVGSDTIEGRGADDIIDGDRYLNVRLSVRNGATEIGSTDLFEHIAVTGTFGDGTDGMTLQQAVFAGLVDPGNIVRASDSNGIVVITQLSPIGVVFPIPEDQLPRVMKRLSAGDRIPVEAYDRAQKEKLGSGRLLTADNQIDTATGTIKLKAEFPNTDGMLFANQFVNVRMPVETRPNATLVPTAAIQRGVQGTFVYVVKDDKTVSVAQVQVGSTQGEVTQIESGVAAGAMVVVDGADRLREGAKVEVVTRDAPVPASPEAAKRGRGKDGAERRKDKAKGA